MLVIIDPPVFDLSSRIVKILEEVLIQALLPEALIEMYLAGVSVRRVEDIAEALWGTRVSCGKVSRLNQKIYKKIERWRMRPIEGVHPMVYLDGISMKRTWAGDVRNVSILVAIGVAVPVISSEAFMHNWAQLTQKVYEVSPLACPRCKKEMRVVAVIENIEVIRRILEHLGLWSANARPTPKAHSPPGLRPLPEDSCSQPPAAQEESYSQLPPARWDC